MQRQQQCSWAMSLRRWRCSPRLHVKIISRFMFCCTCYTHCPFVTFAYARICHKKFRLTSKNICTCMMFRSGERFRTKRDKKEFCAGRFRLEKNYVRGDFFQGRILSVSAPRQSQRGRRQTSWALLVPSYVVTTRGMQLGHNSRRDRNVPRTTSVRTTP